MNLINLEQRANWFEEELSKFKGIQMQRQLFKFAVWIDVVFGDNRVVIQLDGFGPSGITKFGADPEMTHKPDFVFPSDQETMDKLKSLLGV